MTALMWAAAEGHTDVATVLLKAGLYHTAAPLPFICTSLRSIAAAAVGGAKGGVA